MVKIVVLYPQPADPAAFDSHYFGSHAPLVKKLPGLARLEAAHLKSGPDTTHPYYFLAELYFEDREALKAALKSPEMGVLVADVQAHIPSGNVVYLSDEIRS
jgi:uncharacterized protein (TIGR02118 family)